MVTYKQPEKERSRDLIWNHAIESLTLKRNENRILNASYMEHLWLYCQQQLNEHLDIDTYVRWKEYADVCYGSKKSEELKVAFFCGNEPENDVKHLLRLGVRIENIYAFEYDTVLFKEAVSSLHDSYPLLKIYKGKIEQYAELQNTKFDIVYLDFTGSLIKEYKTVVQLLDMNALSDFSILAINTCYPDSTEENIQYLANYFFNDTFFESSVYTGKDVVREEADTWFYRLESCDAYGISDVKELYPIIETNFDDAYSAFQTAFVLDYANIHKASYEVFKSNILSNRLLKKDILHGKNKVADFLKNYHSVLLQETLEDGRCLMSSQFVADGFNNKSEGGQVSRIDAVKISETFLESPYRHSVLDYSKWKEWCGLPEEQRGDEPEADTIETDFKAFLSDEVREIVDTIKQWFHGRFNFCDQPMEHLWLELLLFQFGHPYHTNIGNHKRYSYKAKQRKMCIDIFTLDKCRALYDWMPMMEYFVYDMQNHDRQMISRMCIDAIDKQLLHIVDEIYYGAALVGINEHEWSKNKVLPNREEIVLKSDCLLKRVIDRVAPVVKTILGKG